jgi:O-antigen ligase
VDRHLSAQSSFSSHTICKFNGHAWPTTGLAKGDVALSLKVVGGTRSRSAAKLPRLPMASAAAAILAIAVGISLPTQVHISILGGLANLKPWMIAMAIIVVYALITARSQSLYWKDPIALLVVFSAAVILARSLWRLKWGGPEITFPVLSEWTGVPSWSGATKTRGVITAMLLLGYAVIVVVIRALSERENGRLVVRYAIDALVATITLYALIFLAVLAYSILVYRGDAAAWPVQVRGIQLGPTSASHAVLLIGPVSGIEFGAAALLAAGRATGETGLRRNLLVGATAILAIGTVLVFSRAAWVATLVGAIVLLAASSSRLQLSRRMIVVAGLAVFGFGAAIAASALIFSLAIHGNTLSRLLSSGGTVGARLGEYRGMLAAFAGSPVFGNGAEAYRPLTSGLPAEDFIIEIAYSGGLLAVAPLIAAHVWLLVQYLRAKNVSRDPIWLLAALTVGLIGALFTSGGWDPTYWLTFGLTLAAIRHPEWWQTGSAGHLA